jgi:hypothetical protein
LLDKGRRKYKREEFYHMNPEIKTSAHSYALEKVNIKEATFSVKNLAKFVTLEFEKITELKFKLGELIRSVSSSNIDILKWGARGMTIKIDHTLKVMNEKTLLRQETILLSIFLRTKNYILLKLFVH